MTFQKNYQRLIVLVRREKDAKFAVTHFVVLETLINLFSVN